MATRVFVPTSRPCPRYPVEHLSPPVIALSDLKAVREFLTSYREEARRTRPADPTGPADGTTVVRQGIARARRRSRPESPVA